MAFTKVDKILGENIKSINRLNFKSNLGGINTFNQNRKKYCQFLENKGYKTFTIGNYITATKENESNTFFFASHNSSVHNYLIPVNLENRVQYFVFFDEIQQSVYIVAYNKVREYCKNINTAIRFTVDGPLKMFIPDSWAKKQVLNTERL